MGFQRRYGFFPGNNVITQIEGVVIIDLPAPGSSAGVGVGVAGLVGEFADMTFATAVDASGNVTTSCRGVEAFSSQDFLNKVGGFDETIGDFGRALGNGFQATRNKTFSRLVLFPINLCSSLGVRYFRVLPLCTASTNAASVVPIQGGTIAAGREFRAGVARLRIGARVQFTNNGLITTGVGGSTVAGVAAATQVFDAAGGFDWTTIVRPDGTLGAHKGDILVIGFNNAGAPSTDAGTYRVHADPASGNAITIESLDGSNFAFAGVAGTQPWRLHLASDADTAPVIVPGATVPGGYAAADIGGYTVPSRPLTNFAGGSTDGNWTAGTTLQPAVAPPALTGSSWDPLSGLEGRIMPAGTFAFTAAIQGINAPNSAGLDALYATAFAASLADASPASDVDLIWAARKSTNIRSDLKQNELSASANGKGRVAVVSPELTNVTTAAVIAAADPGVGANRDEGVIYSWPGAVDFVPEAVSGGISGNSPGPFRLKTADGLTTLDGNLDETFDSYLVSLLSNLPPENNPGQSSPPVPAVLASVLGIQRGITTTLQMADYISLRANGIAALRIDKTVGPQIQSGVTTSLVAGQTNINRRRFANFAEDSLAQILMPFNKDVLTDQLKDAALGECNAFLNELLSPNNPAAQRIAAYSLDDVSGNTPELEGLGIFVIIAKIKMLPTADFIVLQAQIGPTVQVTQVP